jgi:hypothetical protein
MWEEESRPRLPLRGTTCIISVAGEGVDVLLLTQHMRPALVSLGTDVPNKCISSWLIWATIRERSASAAANIVWLDNLFVVALSELCCCYRSSDCSGAASPLLQVPGCCGLPTSGLFFGTCRFSLEDVDDCAASCAAELLLWPIVRARRGQPTDAACFYLNSRTRLSPSW